MSRFSYTAILTGGQHVTGNVRSHDQREAVRKLLEMGYHPVAVEATDHRRGAAMDVPHLWSRWGHRVRPTDLAIFTRQMASLLKAGLPMMQALSTLHRQCAHKGLAKIIEDLEATLSRDACALTEAMEEHPQVFDPVYRGLVRSGEEGGNLTEVLNNLADHLSRFAKLRGQVVSAFIYPLFLLILGTAAVFVLIAFVIPKFEELFASFGQQLPMATRVLLATSGFLSRWWWVVLAATAGAVLGGMALLRREPTRRAFDRAVLRLPVFGPMVLKLEISRIARTLAALLDSGVRILDALKVTADTVRNRAVRGTFERIGEQVATGEPLADAVEKARVYPPLVVNLIRTGESTGQLRQMLGELSSIYEDEADRAVTGAVKLLEPVLIVAMGLVIAGIIAAVLLPIFRANTMVG